MFLNESLDFVKVFVIKLELGKRILDKNAFELCGVSIVEWIKFFKFLISFKRSFIGCSIGFHPQQI